MKLLVSVRDVDEALQAAAAGADYIDLKEPSAGALGALPLPTARAIVAALRQRLRPGVTSATVGDFAPGSIEPVLARARATAACGVDVVKVGLAPGDHALLARLAALEFAIVPVLIVDSGVDRGGVSGVDADLLAAACTGPFPALMLDTIGKSGGSLLDRVDGATLDRFVRTVRRSGKLAGLAGALRLGDLPRLRALGPDFAGFRSAVCDGARTGRLDARRVAQLAAALAPDRAEASPA